MENLNAEQVKKWLEICAEDTPYPDQSQALLDALALINSQEQRIKELENYNADMKVCGCSAKELAEKCERLAEENERLRADKERITNTYCEAMCEMKNRITCQIVLPDEKLEEIKNECLERVELDIKAIQADTVRKMQERLKAEMRNTAKYSFGGREYSVIGEAFIDQIAKEMLEGKE